jgi:hypothetical protein
MIVLPISIAGLWCASWIVGAAAYTARKQGAALVHAYGQLLPAFAATTCLGFFIANTSREPATRQLVLWVHHTSFFALFAFLGVAQFLQAEAWWKRRFGCPDVAVASSYRRLWLLTELLPGAIAATIFLTGLRLLWEAPGANSPSQVWLMLIIPAFGVFFFDGILGYTPIVRRWTRYWDAASTRPGSASPGNKPTFGEHVQLLMHFLSWPILFALGALHYHFANPVSDWIASAQQDLDFLPAGWPSIVVAMLLWSLGGAAVVAMRTWLKESSGAHPLANCD